MHQLIDKKSRIIIYLITFLILSTTNIKVVGNNKKYLSKIDKVNVTGLSVYDNQKIVNELINNLIYKNIFNINKEEIHEIISKYNVVQEYNIKKIYPSKLNIKIKPTQFIAKTLDNNNELLVGSNGKLISNKKYDKKLPHIFGEFNSKKFLNFKKNIYRSNFNFVEFKHIFLYPSNRWDILTVNDVLIKLPKKDILKSLNLAHKIINNDNFKFNKIIDLRISSQIIIK